MADDRFSAKCFLFAFLLLFYSVAFGQNDAIEKHCAADNFDVKNLTAKLWKFSLPSTSPLSSSCLKQKGKNLTDGCQITMAFCQSVNMGGTCRNSSMCESYPAANDTYSLGVYLPANNPFNTSALSSGVGFRVNYEPGENYTLPNNTTCTLQTVMTFFCNATALWSINKSANVLDVPVKPSVNFTSGLNVCTYNITFDFAGACPVTTPSSLDELSPGSVMIMLFIVLAILYFVMGCFINITRGKVGEDLVPHHHFWAALPIYIMEGILFTLSCCMERRSKQAYESI